MGAPLYLRHPELGNIRKRRVKGFGHHLVFYEPRSDDISVVHVLHAASDWWQLLGYESQQTPAGL
jgi:plasmid stabilization system protein ParE